MSISKEPSNDSVIVLDFTIDDDDHSTSAVFLDFTMESKPAEESCISLDYLDTESETEEPTHCPETTLSVPQTPSYQTLLSQPQGASTPMKANMSTTFNRKRTTTPRSNHTRKKQCLDMSSPGK